MNAFQIYWTEPFFASSIKENKIDINKEELIDNLFADYYILTMILSALQWKKLHNSKIKLYTDSIVMRYLEKFNLLSIWDEYDCETFKKVDKEIDLKTFWSAGKFYAYLNEKVPCIAIDVDLILWKNIDYLTKDVELGFTHWEDSTLSQYYINKESLNIPKEYEFKKEWEWDLNAANTSMVYFNNENFKNHYSNEVIKYMKNNVINGEYSIARPELLFVEQRLLTMCAKERGIIKKTKPFIDLIWSPVGHEFYKNELTNEEWEFYEIDEQKLATHIWVEKPLIENDKIRRKKYCQKLIKLISVIDMNIVNNLKSIKCVQEYANEIYGNL